MEQKAPSPQLDYAPPPPWHHRRGFRRAALLCGLLSVVLSGFLWAPRLWQHAQLLYWQRQCMNYTAPIGEIVLEREPTAAGKLLREHPETYVGVPDPPMAIVWSRIKALDSLRAGTPASRLRYGAVFLHQRISPSGHARLVAAETFLGGIPELQLHATVYRPGGLLREPAECISALSVPSPWFRALRVYAGQPDPDNASHFTIDYDDADGQRHTVDGWLKDDDTVLLEERDPLPVIPRPASRMTTQPAVP